MSDERDPRPQPPHLLREIEHAAARGWPALQTELIDGWLWRYAGGGSIRANSVATLAFSGDQEKATQAVERAYRAAGAQTSAFTISSVSVPPGLDEWLAARGYQRGEPHVTMTKAVNAEEKWPVSVEISDRPTAQWREIYYAGLTSDRRAMAGSLIDRLPASARYFTALVNTDAAASGLSIPDGKLCSVQCMATAPSERRAGAATRVLAAIEANAAAYGATHLYLQTGGDNVAARALYTRNGFRVIGEYHTRSKAV